MKILIVSQYFWPENFIINDLAVDLVKRGHVITVLTGRPNYPSGKIYKGYGFFSHRIEYYEGVKIYRVPILPRGNASNIRLTLNYLSYVFFSCFFILSHWEKFDLSFTFAISPITQAFPAILHRRLFRSKMFVWVQDLWPESVSAAGKVDSSVLIKSLNKMVRFIYNISDGILVQSKAFIPSIQEKGIPVDKIMYAPNWADSIFINEIITDKEKFQYLIPEGFIVMFAGNIGEAQDFVSIIKAAMLTKHIPQIKWIIIGDGRKRSWVENEVRIQNLSDTVILLGRFPLEEMPHFFVHADLMLLCLENNEIFSKTIPSKVQAYLAAGKPIVGMLSGIGAEIILDADCGYVCEASNYKLLANNVIKAYYDNSLLSKKGDNGRDYYYKNFSKELNIDNMISLFKRRCNKMNPEN